MDEFRIVSCNFQDNGGGDVARWVAMHDLLAGLRPHVLLRQELSGASASGSRGMFAAERRLSTSGPVRGFLGEVVQGDRPTGVFLRSDVVDVLKERRHRFPWWVPPTDLTVRLFGAPRPLRIASVHLNHYSAPQRLLEAQWLTTLASDESPAIIGGDFNSFPEPGVDVAAPDWDRVPDRAHYAHRTSLLACGGRASDDGPDRTLRAAGFEDAARFVFRRTGSGNAVLPTAGPARQGGKRRIDRIYLSASLLSSVVDAEVVDARGLSDHDIVVVRLDAARLREILTDRVEVCDSYVA